MIAYGLAVEGLDDQIDEVDRIGSPPTFETVGRLESVLRNAFLNTQARTHIITTSLKLSGRSSSDFDGKTWQAGITYGGPSTGPINPVEYAVYEMARGGEHNFFRDLPLFDQAYLDAVASHFSG